MPQTRTVLRENSQRGSYLLAEHGNHIVLSLQQRSRNFLVGASAGTQAEAELIIACRDNQTGNKDTMGANAAHISVRCTFKVLAVA